MWAWFNNTIVIGANQIESKEGFRGIGVQLFW